MTNERVRNQGGTASNALVPAINEGLGLFLCFHLHSIQGGISMKKLSSAEVRQMFLDFFKEKGHSVEPSASLVPHEDPTLLWINSGVATLKKYFL